MTLFYSERRNALGKWMPQATPSRPIHKGAEGAVTPIRNVQPILPEHWGWDLEKLEAYYGQGQQLLTLT